MKADLTEDQFQSIGVDVAELCVKSGLVESKTKARKAIEQNGIRVHDMLVTDPFARVVVDLDANKVYLIQREVKNVSR